ncbi:hypothetical protein DFH29DRAFT_877339 [Suillus ampliporus]|nr:hypothetical protein DFH29DRAFT_877339 [Suillus ampliporus]
MTRASINHLTASKYCQHELRGHCTIPCTKPGCNCWFKNRSGYTQHTNAMHPILSTQQSAATRAPALPPDIDDVIDFGDASNSADVMDFGDDNDPMQPTAQFFGAGDQSYRNHHPFLTAHSIDHLLNIWAASLIQAGSKTTLFSDHRGIYKTIDNTPIGDVKWQSFAIKYTGTIPDEGATPWMADSHDVWFRGPRDVVQNMLANPDYAIEIDLKPYCEFATDNDERRWQDFMSGDWVWSQADMIANDTDAHGSTFVPIILGSDKTTVSVATGQNNYYPLYVSIGNVRNNVPMLTCNAVAVIGFLAMPKITIVELSMDWDPILQTMKNRLHTDALIEECDHMTLWNEYGIVGELVVLQLHRLVCT